MSPITEEPEDNIEWAESGIAPPQENSTVPEEPASDTRDTGWGFGEPPGHAQFNWLMRAFSRWIQWLSYFIGNHVHDGGSDERSVDKIDLEEHIDYSDGDGNEAEGLKVLQNSPSGFVIEGPRGFGAIAATTAGEQILTDDVGALLNTGSGEYITHRPISSAGTTLRSTLAPDIQAPTGTSSALILDRGVEVDGIRSFNTPAQVFLRAIFGIFEDPEDGSTLLFQLIGVVSGAGTREDTNLINVSPSTNAEGFELYTGNLAGGGHDSSDLLDVQVSGGNLSKASGETFAAALTPIFEVLPDEGEETFVNISFISAESGLQTLSDVVEDANSRPVTVDEFLEVHIRVSYLDSPIWADKDFSRDYN